MSLCLVLGIRSKRRFASTNKENILDNIKIHKNELRTFHFASLLRRGDTLLDWKAQTRQSGIISRNPLVTQPIWYSLLCRLCFMGCSCCL